MTLTYLPLLTLSNGNFRHLNTRHFASYKKIAKSIVEDGLLNPIIIAKRPDLHRKPKTKNHWRVIDGRKRLIALNLLKISKNLPRSLVSIPCENEKTQTHGAKLARPTLLSGYELTDLIQQNHANGHSVKALAHRFHCSENLVQAALALKGLNPLIDAHFRNGRLSFEQVGAFATMPNKDSQYRLLMELGPFVNQTEIIEAITAGATIVKLPNGESMILPSRGEYDAENVNIIANLKIAA